jgi:hypothetical protein
VRYESKDLATNLDTSKRVDEVIFTDTVDRFARFIQMCYLNERKEGFISDSNWSQSAVSDHECRLLKRSQVLGHSWSVECLHLEQAVM